jgi:hypothetical protein
MERVGTAVAGQPLRKWQVRSEWQAVSLQDGALCRVRWLTTGTALHPLVEVEQANGARLTMPWERFQRRSKPVAAGIHYPWPWPKVYYHPPTMTVCVVESEADAVAKGIDANWTETPADYGLETAPATAGPSGNVLRYEPQYEQWEPPPWQSLVGKTLAAVERHCRYDTDNDTAESVVFRWTDGTSLSLRAAWLWMDGPPVLEVCEDPAEAEAREARNAATAAAARDAWAALGAPMGGHPPRRRGEIELSPSARVVSTEPRR